MTIFEYIIVFCIFISGSLTCKLLSCVFKNKKIKNFCGRYANIIECTEYPNCNDCPYKTDKVWLIKDYKN